MLTPSTSKDENLKMRASVYFLDRILFSKKNKVLKYAASCVSSRRFTCSFEAVFQKGSKVADNINSVKYYSTKAPESKSPKPTYNSSYTYGVPHSDSNIPIVIFAGSENETKKVKIFRQHKQDLMLWHHTFWLQQNKKFTKEKKAYLQQRQHEHAVVMDGKERADDLSLFYKEFLDKNFRVHFKYQREWYKRSILLFWYGFQVDLEKLMKRIMKKITRSKLK